MKAPGANLNTHIRTAPGILVDAKSNPMAFSKEKVDIRCTSDSYGETVSFTAKGIQISVRVKDVEAVIQEARRDR